MTDSRQHLPSNNSDGGVGSSEPTPAASAINNYEPDTKLIMRASQTAPILLELISNDEQPAPTVGHLLALYFRLTDELCYRACFNEFSLDKKPRNAWFGSETFSTLSFMANYSISYDRIYRLCVNRHLLDVIKNFYEERVVFETELEEEHVFGITTKITSLEQAYIYLDGMTSRVFTANFSFILNRLNRLNVQKVFDRINIDEAEKTSLENGLLDVVDAAVYDQATLLESEAYAEQGISPAIEEYLMLQSLKYLNYPAVFRLSMQQLGLTALSTLLLGLDEKSANTEDIGLPLYVKDCLYEEPMRKSLIRSSVMAHRYHYPSKVLSTLN